MTGTLSGRARGHWPAQLRFDAPRQGSELHRICLGFGVKPWSCDCAANILFSCVLNDSETAACESLPEGWMYRPTPRAAGFASASKRHLTDEAKRFAQALRMSWADGCLAGMSHLASTSASGSRAVTHLEPDGCRHPSRPINAAARRTACLRS